MLFHLNIVPICTISCWHLMKCAVICSWAVTAGLLCRIAYWWKGVGHLGIFVKQHLTHVLGLFTSFSSIPDRMIVILLCHGDGIGYNSFLHLQKVLTTRHGDADREGCHLLASFVHHFWYVASCPSILRPTFVNAFSAHFGSTFAIKANVVF